MSRIVIITGTSKGIGRELAQHYLEKGDIVVGCSRSDCSIEHYNYKHYQLDVTDESLVTKMVREVFEKYGQIHVLINNAGIAGMNHFILTPYETAKKIINTNYMGTFLFVREVGKIMMRKKFGRIINFSTVAVAHNLEGEAVYASSKAAIESITKVVAKELGSYGITVNAVGPTPIETDLIKNVSKDKIQSLIDMQAVKRLADFDDIANVLDFYADERSGFVTGQVLYLGGVM